jgi:hypothetical protein
MGALLSTLVDASRVRESLANGGQIVEKLFDRTSPVRRAGTPRLEESMKPETRTKRDRSPSFPAGVGRVLRRAAQDARKTARMYGTPLYVWQNGRMVAERS